ncbi:MAG: hypothetical protein EAY70_03575 [Sphingomonadales bacterium]|nr:MAG: hypothetical protein EAY70_03575 [Sphingomonadales bacterium]
MQSLSRNPAAAYRRVALEARIAASGSADLTRICLEEALAAVGQALIAMEQALAGHGQALRGSCAGHEPLARAQSIMLWLARSVAPAHPLGGSLRAFYGGLAGQIGANILQADMTKLAEIRKDISDVLEAASGEPGDVSRDIFAEHQAPPINSAMIRAASAGSSKGWKWVMSGR